jgi:probable F420-dependent oxidoreductase
MAHPRPFRFGVTAQHAGSGDHWRSFARKVEDLGLSTLLVPDHFNDQLAPIPAITAAAEATTRLRVGTLVLDNDYKHPVVVAKELATVDLLSGGRVEWGMGAGWFTPDYEQSGLAMDPPRVRVDRLDESITVMKHLFGDGVTQHVGEHYRVTGLSGTPTPVQRPHPPLLIGGAGDRVLGIAARRANIVGIAPSMTTNAIFGDHRELPVAAADRQIARVRAAGGDRYGRLELTMVTSAFSVTDRRDEVLQQIAGSMQLAPDDIAASPHHLIGSVDEICDALEERRARWDVSYWVIPAPFLDAAAPVVERLAGR